MSGLIMIIVFVAAFFALNAFEFGRLD